MASQAAKVALKEKTFGFGFRALKNYPELIPLVSILSFAALGATAFTTYALLTKSDVHVRKSNLPRWAVADPEKRAKLVTFRQKYEKIEELEDLKKDIGSFKSK